MIAGLTWAVKNHEVSLHFHESMYIPLQLIFNAETGRRGDAENFIFFSASPRLSVSALKNQ